MDNEKKLNIKITSNINKVASDFAKYTQALNSTNQSLQRFSENSKSVTLTTSQLDSKTNKLIRTTQKFKKNADGTLGSIQSYSQSVSDASTKTSSFGSNLASAFSKGAMAVTALLTGIKMVTNTIGKATAESIDYSENLNLFNTVFKNVLNNGTTTFSKLGQQATVFQNKLKTNFGANMSESMYYQSLFQSMAESQGISDSLAYVMSENSTKLTYDLASLFNKEETDVAEKIRAGIYAGQTKPLRDLGLDVTETTLQGIVDELAKTDKSLKDFTVSTASQAEKQMLRYIAVLKQAAVAQGDYANTIESPANQLKVLKNEIATLSAAFGDLLIGPYQKLLQFANAIVRTVRYVVEAIKGAFGIKAEDYNTGIASITDDMEDFEDEVDGANKKVSKLKRQLLGFDEVNNINENDSSGSGSSKNKSIYEDLMKYIEDYDSGLDKVKLKAEEISEQLMSWLGFERNATTGAWEFGAMWDNIREPIARLKTSASSLFSTLIDYAKTFVDKYINPLFNIYVKMYLPVAIDYARSIFYALDTILQILKPILVLLLGIKILIKGTEILILIGILYTLKVAIEVIADLLSPLANLISDISGGFDKTGIKAKDTTQKFKEQEAAAKKLDDALSKLRGEQKSYTEAVDEAEESQKKLDEIQEKLSISGAELNEMVEQGTLDYKDMNEQQREVFKAYLDNEKAQNQLKQSTENLKVAQDDLTLAELEKMGTLADSRIEYDKYKEAIVKAYNEGKISAEEASKLIGEAMKNMSSDTRKSFVEDIPNDIKDGLDPKQYEGVLDRLKRTFSNVWKDIKSLFGFGNEEIKVKVSSGGSSGSGRHEFATGGFPEDGLFFANHGELVGKFSNGKTAVANNEQITEGIKRAVVQGMSQAYVNTGGSEVKLNITTEEGILVKKVVNGINELTSKNGESPLWG